MAEKLKVTLVKSPIGAIPKQKATVEALRQKPITLIEKLIFALIGAAVSAAVTFFTGG